MKTKELSKQRQLGEKYLESQKRIGEREKKIQELRQTVDTLKHSAQAAVEDSERIFTELICYIEKRRSELKEMIRAQEKSEVSRAEGLLEQLEQEVVELRRRDVELKQLSNTEDHIHFLQWPDSCLLTLDPNTTYQNLCLSEGNRKVTWSGEVQYYPDHPDRFTFVNQVLCREGLSGVCYWKVEWSGKWVRVAVSNKEISRKGNGRECVFGRNDQSWVLFCSTSRCCFSHNNTRTDIHVPCSSRVGVYLDHRAGTLSFYSVSDTMTLLHRVQTTFTQPLYPGFYVYNGSVKILTPIQ
ncbi:stonustoxin subunit beta-like [Esox lucius]|uniref:stonustoxin subunit beta-like n=1 Tax=Esox lucius TaxID=8010 RepID=UPI0014768112|nr:stonustoxin subunit beta-like [Esox lucius]